MKSPLKVSRWRYILASIEHWTWCELHHGSTWYRRALRGFRFSAVGNILLAWVVMAIWLVVIALMLGVLLRFGY